MLKKLPVGIQDFKTVIEDNYIYVDKTKYLLDLINSGKVYFLSRPRRFGKSLTISALSYLFKGRKELFKETYIYDRYDFKKYPVIKISLSELDTKNMDTIEETLLYKLKKIYAENNIECETKSIKIAFTDLIYKLAKKERVVVLIDEYDKPLLDNYEYKQELEEIRKFLRNFYLVLKESDEYLKFVFLTGISKFSKVGVFSGLNNLSDISLNERYSTFLGCTEDELDFYFKDYIEEVRIKNKLTQTEVMQKIKNWYNGYTWDGENHVYNPFSMLCLFRDNEFRNFWFETGIPGFLIDYIKQKSVEVAKIDEVQITPEVFNLFEIEAAPPESFLWQAGYLTIKKKLEQSFILGFPNLEVKLSFSMLMLFNSYMISHTIFPNYGNIMRSALDRKDFAQVFETVQEGFRQIPYDLPSGMKDEKDYESFILAFLWGSAINAKAEDPTSLGKLDIIIESKDMIYIIELKKGPAAKAVKQIKDKGYHEKFIKYNKEIRLIGIEINVKKRNLKKFIETNITD